MAKLTVTFENGKINKKLEFQNNVFEYTMAHSEFGMIADKQSILCQFTDKYTDDMDDTELLEHLDNIDFGNEDDMIMAIDYLSLVE